MTEDPSITRKVAHFIVTMVGGNLTCPCGNDELVLVQCLPPFENFFEILCRKCKWKGSIGYDRLKRGWDVR